jgi:curli biogenesis system outer membrane secretion channel CsgG
MNLKKVLPILAVLLSIAGGLAATSAAAQNAPKRRPLVAVLDFDYATVQSYSSAMFGSNVDVGKGITDLLVAGLVKDGTYRIVERKALDKLMAEQNFSNSERADPSSAAKLGKLLGVDAIIVGSITQFGNETKKTNLGGMGGNWGGFGVGGIGHSKSNANVGVTARLVNVDTGEIMAIAEGAGQSSRSSTSLLGGGGNWHGFGGGNADFGSSDFQQTIIGEAVKMAVDKLTTEVVADVSKVSVRTVTVDGLVAAVDGGQVILNVGKRGGVNVGDLLEVVRVTKEIKDPSTGAVIRRLTTSIGIIKATDVDDASAVCNPVSGSGFQTGDRVKSVAQ